MPIKIKCVKSKVLCSKYLNIGKKEYLYDIFDKVRDLKNQMSKFCYENLRDLYLNKKFMNNYRIFNNDFVSAHITQTLFSEIINHYKTHTVQLINNKISKIRIQDKILIHTKRKKNRLEIVFRKTVVSSFLSYAVKSYLWDIPINVEDFIRKFKTVKSKNAEKFLEWYCSKSDEFKTRFFSLMVEIIKFILNRVKLIEYKTGTFRLTSGTGYAYDLIYDSANKKFKWFLKIKLHKNKKPVYLPILENNRYFQSLRKEDYRKQLLVIDDRSRKNSKKIRFSITKDEYIYFPEEVKKIIGIDLNVNKETFIISDSGIKASYPEDQFEYLISKLEEIDKIGYQNISRKEKFRLNKLVRKFSWYVKVEVSKFVRELVRHKVTDIVMEDLDVSGKLYGYLTVNGKKIKTSRFIRLLHLSSIKHIFVNMCHNKGIRVHIVPSNYTSQQCSKCGYIDPLNRKNQSVFECRNCGFKENADLNAAINIRNRIFFREKLLVQDKVFPELRPKKLKSSKIKRILLENVSPVFGIDSFHHQVLSIYDLLNVSRYFQ